jgi:hypothetical protein
MNNSTDEAAIKQIVDYYTEGMRTGDVAVLKKAFHPLAILCGYLGDYQIASPIQVLYDWRAENPAPETAGETFDCVVLSVEITGRVASAKVRETHEGEVAIDYFHLLNDNGRWSIVSKLWDAE